MMNCKRIIDIYIDQDSIKSIPVRVRLHLLFCMSCRRRLLFLKESFLKLNGTSLYRIDRSRSDDIMKVIKKRQVNQEQQEQAVTSFQWIITGSILLISIFLIPFNDSIIWIRVQYGVNFELPFVIIMGLAVTVYSVLFTGTHMDEIKELISSIDRKLH